MYYIVFDLEFNQDIPEKNTEGYKLNPQDNSLVMNSRPSPFEIIQIGAVKLDFERKTAAVFDRYVKPTVYSKVSPFITELTGITTEQLLPEEDFPAVFKAFLTFIDSSDAVFVIWGKSDIKELYRSAQYHKLDLDLLSKQYIDIQPQAALHLHFPPKKLPRLQKTVEALCLPQPYPFHNAFHDAWYTAEIFKKIIKSDVKPAIYNPFSIKPASRPRQPKRITDFDALIRQFEKMYGRPMTEEEQAMIKLAYRMGRTGQFLMPLAALKTIPE
jgi:DNA polymerase III epsilon subunit-like protein